MAKKKADQSNTGKQKKVKEQEQQSATSVEETKETQESTQQASVGPEGNSTQQGPQGVSTQQGSESKDEPAEDENSEETPSDLPEQAEGNGDPEPTEEDQDEQQDDAEQEGDDSAEQDEPVQGSEQIQLAGEARFVYAGDTWADPEGVVHRSYELVIDDSNFDVSPENVEYVRSLSSDLRTELKPVNGYFEIPVGAAGDYHFEVKLNDGQMLGAILTEAEYEDGAIYSLISGGENIEHNPELTLASALQLARTNLRHKRELFLSRGRESIGMFKIKRNPFKQYEIESRVISDDVSEQERKAIEGMNGQYVVGQIVHKD